MTIFPDRFEGYRDIGKQNLQQNAVALNEAFAQILGANWSDGAFDVRETTSTVGSMHLDVEPEAPEPEVHRGPVPSDDATREAAAPPPAGTSRGRDRELSEASTGSRRDKAGASGGQALSSEDQGPRLNLWYPSVQPELLQQSRLLVCRLHPDALEGDIDLTQQDANLMLCHVSGKYPQLFDHWEIEILAWCPHVTEALLHRRVLLYPAETLTSTAPHALGMQQCCHLHAVTANIFWDRIARAWWPRAAQKQLYGLQLKLQLNTPENRFDMEELESIFKQHHFDVKRAGFFGRPDHAGAEKRVKTAEERSETGDFGYKTTKPSDKSRGSSRRKMGEDPYVEPFKYKVLKDFLRCLFGMLPLTRIDEDADTKLRDASHENSGIFASQKRVKELDNLLPDRLFHHIENQYGFKEQTILETTAILTQWMLARAGPVPPPTERIPFTKHWATAMKFAGFEMTEFEVSACMAKAVALSLARWQWFNGYMKIQRAGTT